MHPNPAFRGHADARNLAFARDIGFGGLIIAPDGAPLIAHVPFRITDDETTAEMHLLKSNPVFRAIGNGTPATLIINGPHGYVSPDWYETPDQVPTWNYVAVHLSGTLTKTPPDGLHDLLDRQSATFEEALRPKRPWTTDKMSDGTMDRMMRAIAPVEIKITATDGTWKLGQNKPEAARLAAAAQMAAHTTGYETARLAHLMQHPPEPETSE